MKVVATSRILDEADIVEAFVRHTAHYASHHIFLDNGSRDGTIEILRLLAEEGFGITVFQNRAVAFNEMHFNTSLYAQAVRVHAADWVLCLDTDEFVDDRAVDGGLVAALERFDADDRSCVSVPSVNYHPSAGDDDGERIVPLRIRRRDEPVSVSKCFFSKRLAHPTFRVGPGGHLGFLGDKVVERVAEPGLLLAHYPGRSAFHFVAKFAKGWSKVLAAGPESVARGYSTHYRAPFEQLRDAPEHLLASRSFLVPGANAHLADDPIEYRGGALRYTGASCDRMRAVRTMVGYLEDLSTRYGELIERSEDAGRIAREADARLELVIGEEECPLADPRTMDFDRLPTQSASLPKRRTGVAKLRTRAADAVHRLAMWLAPRDAAGATRRLGPDGMVRRLFLDAAAALRAEGDGLEADRLLGRAVAAFPDDADLRAAHALSAHRDGRYVVAAARWEAATRMAPGRPLYAACLSANLRESGQAARAAAVMEAARRRFPDDIDVLTESARAAQACQEHVLAVGLWRRALDRGDGHPDWWVSYLQCLRRIEDVAEYEREAARALRAYPDYPMLRQETRAGRGDRAAPRANNWLPEQDSNLRQVD